MQEARRFQDNRQMNVVRPPGNIPGTHLCYRLGRPQGHSAAGRIMSMKNSYDTIGNRTRDLPTCSAVPQPTAPPRTPSAILTLVNKLSTQRTNHHILKELSCPSFVHPPPPKKNPRSFSVNLTWPPLGFVSPLIISREVFDEVG